MLKITRALVAALLIASVSSADANASCVENVPSAPMNKGCSASYTGILVGTLLITPWRFIRMNQIEYAKDLLDGAQAGYGCVLEKEAKKIARQCRGANADVIRQAIVDADNAYAFCPTIEGRFDTAKIAKEIRATVVNKLKTERPELCR